MTDRALEGLRVLEVCDEVGSYCGRLLSGLGADVIKIEPPGGGRQRNRPPYYLGQASPDNAIAFWTHNTGKKSVILDLDSPAGQQQALQIALASDIVLEDNPVGWMAARGLGFDTLRARKPSLVYASVTGFGQTGPHAHYAYSDIVGQGMGGLVTLAGFPDEPPYQLYGHQANMSASIFAAQGVLAAVLVAEASGQGQLVDVSAQEAASMSQETAMQIWDLTHVVRSRSGGLIGSIAMGFPGYGLYRCKDGHVFGMVAGRAGLGFSALVDWMRELGMAEDLDEEPYAGIAAVVGMHWLAEAVARPDWESDIAPALTHMQAVTERFFASLPANHAYREGQRRRLLIGLVSRPHDLAHEAQLEARDWYVTFEAPDGQPVKFIGPPYRLSVTPAVSERPPRLGEHTEAVLAALAAEGAAR